MWIGCSNKFNAEQLYLWRVVDHEGEVMERLVTKGRDRRADLTFLIKATEKYGVPTKLITDKLISYGPAFAFWGTMRILFNNSCSPEGVTAEYRGFLC